MNKFIAALLLVAICAVVVESRSPFALVKREDPLCNVIDTLLGLPNLLTALLGKANPVIGGLLNQIKAMLVGASPLAKVCLNDLLKDVNDEVKRVVTSVRACLDTALGTKEDIPQDACNMLTGLEGTLAPALPCVLAALSGGLGGLALCVTLALSGLLTVVGGLLKYILGLETEVIPTLLEVVPALQLCLGTSTLLDPLIAIINTGLAQCKNVL